MKKALFVYNPHAGKSTITESLSEILQILSEGYELTVYPTKYARDGYERVKAADGMYDLIACCGGDGTFNETIAAVMEHTQKKPPVGYIPGGTTNDYAQSLGIHTDMMEAARDIVKGNLRYCDVGKFNGRYYNYVAAFGAFTEVSYATPQEFKNVLGHQAYILEGIKSIPFIKPTHLSIQVNEGTYEGDFIFGMITNTISVGGFKNLSGKSVMLDDGLFECTFVKKFKHVTDVTDLVSAVLRNDPASPEAVLHLKSDHITIHAPEEISWVLDGEFGGKVKDVDIQIVKDGVAIIVP